MTGPDPRDDNRTWTRNEVGDNHGTSVQTGQAHGDVNIGPSTHTTVSLSAVGVVVGAVMTLVIGLVVWKLVAAGETPAVQAPAAQTPASASTTGTPARGAPAKEVHLRRGTGVDVDGDDPKAGRADGATGDIDLYLNEFNLLYANGSDITYDSGPEQQAEERCREAASGGMGDPAVLAADAGLQYCLVTSDKRVAWVRVTSSTLSSFDSTASLTFVVRTWPA
ncbi:hypothetical protein SAMN05216553_105112 [Lentzea fradiae]|uniref:Uncharacterized protein n=1 Tax=Lentzea fradiae TaxID=200378 RepID=A0A1G7R6X9_9PSEU|nr:hypothetical protein [Lentzea fradiae]SDG05720.1 hypothetical protein SAMN05216553_105112 [Lentzea fradiae]